MSITQSKESPKPNVSRREISPGEVLEFENTAHPLIYADQLVGMQIGSFTSKITFGTSIDGSVVRPSVTIALPTISLVTLAKQVVATFAESATKEQLKKNMDELFNL